METREHLEQTAAAWISRRDTGPWSVADAAALDSWLAESAGHRVAYYRLNAAWHEAGRLRALKGSTALISPSARRRGPQVADVVEALDSARTRSHPPVARGRTATRHWSRLVVVVAATLLIHVGAALLLLLQGHNNDSRYATALGELQSIPMSDGSRVTLNTDSSLRIALGRSTRRIDLEHGEAFFEVAKDPKRPFIVTVGDCKIIAVGTQFSVRREGDDVQVIVSEGRVRMEHPMRAAERTQQMGTVVSAPPENVLWPAGTIASIRGDRVLLQAEPLAEIDESLSWRVGLLTFHDTPFATVVAEFNRYNSRKILIQDPTLSELRVSGVFRATHLAPFIHLLEQRFHIRASVDEDRVLLSSPQSGP